MSKKKKGIKNNTRTLMSSSPKKSNIANTIKCPPPAPPCHFYSTIPRESRTTHHSVTNIVTAVGVALSFPDGNSRKCLSGNREKGFEESLGLFFFFFLNHFVLSA